MTRTTMTMWAPAVAACLLSAAPAEAQLGFGMKVERAQQALEQMEVPRELARIEMIEHGVATGALMEAQRALESVQGVPMVEAQMALAELTGVGMQAVPWAPRATPVPRTPPVPGPGFGREPAGPPEPWLQQDPADSLYRAARTALNRSEFARAAGMFEQIRSRYPRSGYVPESYYYQAFALQRTGGRVAEQRALALLDEQRAKHPDATTRADADQLRLRLQGTLAQGGDRGAARALEDAARVDCRGPDQELRATALSALVTMDSGRSLPILREILAARDACSAELRKQAVFLIARGERPEVVDILLDLAQRNPDPDPGVREQAVFWLSRVETPEATTALEGILNGNGSEEIKVQAAFALSRQGSPRAIQALKTYAERQDQPAAVRAQAIYWLGRDEENGGPAYLRQVYSRLNDDALKEQALHAISQSGTREDLAWLIARARDRSESPEVRTQALFWAGRAGMSVADLRGLYAEIPDIEVRQQIIYVLSIHEDAAAVDALMQIATSQDDRALREQAVYWLGRSDDPRAAEFLLRLIRGGR